MIRTGTRVRLKASLRSRLRARTEVAKVKAFLGDIAGGVRLDATLDGFTMWNVADLERAPAKKKPRRSK